jgi:alkylation response protein AidB-like acyl-CoA dehydrogenase
LVELWPTNYKIRRQDLIFLNSHIFENHRPASQAYRKPTTCGPFSQIIHVAIDIGIARAAINETVNFVKTLSRPWTDANVETASKDPLTIYEVGKLNYQLHAAEALMERAALKVDRAAVTLDEATVTETALAVAEAKIGATDIAILATNKLFELAGTQFCCETCGMRVRIGSIVDHS